MPDGGVVIKSTLAAVIDDGVPYATLRIGDRVYDVSCAAGIMSDVDVQHAVELARDNVELKEKNQ